MAPVTTNGRADRMGKTPQAVAGSWQRSAMPWVPGTQSPQSVIPIPVGETAPGGVQTGGNMNQPQQAPVPYPGQWGPEQTHRCVRCTRGDGLVIFDG